MNFDHWVEPLTKKTTFFRINTVFRQLTKLNHDSNFFFSFFFLASQI